MIKKQKLTQFIQIRVNEKEKSFIQLMAKKHSTKGVSEFIMSLLYAELSRLSRFDEEIHEVRKKLMQVYTR